MKVFQSLLKLFSYPLRMNFSKGREKLENKGKRRKKEGRKERRKEGRMRGVMK